MFRAAHSLKNVIRCVCHRPASVIALQHHRTRTTFETYPHVHGRDGVALEVLVVVLSERVVIVKRHAAGPEHLRQERELVRLEALVELLFLGPFLVLVISQSDVVSEHGSLDMRWGAKRDAGRASACPGRQRSDDLFDSPRGMRDVRHPRTLRRRRVGCGWRGRRDMQPMHDA